VTPTDDCGERAGIRREPPPFRVAVVEAVQYLTPYMARVSLIGDPLKDMESPEPAASIRLLLPMPGSAELPEISWTGNEYRLADGGRPIIRTFTPGTFDAGAGRLDIEVVLHEAGATSSWVSSAAPGSVAAVSAPGRGYSVDHNASAYLLAGDATALPAVCQLVAAISVETTLRVIVEVNDDTARMELPSHPRLDHRWLIQRPQEKPGSALLPAIRDAGITGDATIWAAGEAAAMHDIRKYFLDERGFDRSRVTIHGYWKHGR
jgi:NADPH-dependent ferric siderophore reductase